MLSKFAFMTLSDFFAISVGLLLSAFGAAAWIISRRQNKSYEKIARTSTFHCLHCDSVYTAPFGKDIMECPNCGYKNPKLKF